MTVDKVIEQILSKRPEISRKEILERLEAQKRKAGGLFSEATLLRMIALDLGADVPPNEIVRSRLSVGALVPGLGDVTVIGRVVAVFSPRAFEGKRSGRFASLLVADKDGILRVVLWDDMASLVEDGGIEVGQVMRFSHGYTREGRNGLVELHLGEKSETENCPRGTEPKDYPTISRFAIMLGKISEEYENKKIHVIGKVKELFSTYEFSRQDSSSGKVRRFLLADGTGEMPVVVWNDKVDELEKVLKKGAELQIVNAKVKKSSSSGLEIHVDRDTYVTGYVSTKKTLVITDLKEGLSNVNVEGEVITKPVCREVKTSKGETISLTVFELKDETGKIWVSTWRKNAEAASKLELGDRIVLRNAYVKRGFADQIELSTGSMSSITRNEDKRMSAKD